MDIYFYAFSCLYNRIIVKLIEFDMKKIIVNVCLIALLPMLSIAQSRKCATMERMHKEHQQNPSVKMQREELEQYVQHHQHLYNVNKTSVVHTIPVVVHIVLNNPASVTDAQVTSQIAVLNQDFRKLNADTNLIPAPFKGLAADSEIQFCLANIDPNGNPTTGITRTTTSVPAFTADYDSVKFTSMGGIDAWNTSNYLNIWVCNLAGGTLGYAQFPGGSAATDGVVILYTAFGTMGTAAAPYNLGRTATHEVGHYLNLYHIWGDEPLCANDDLVTDTPLQAADNGGCPTYPLLDACQTSAPGVMFMNYMDYVNDACMQMFSLGQKARMKTALTGSRASLIASTVCSPTSITVDMPLLSNVQIYPNPTKNILYIQSAVVLKNATLNIFDYTGKKYSSQNYTNTSEIHISLSDCARGIYLVQLISDNKCYTQKVILE
jgi:hypothetical protein